MTTMEHRADFKEIYTAARTLLSDREKWTRNSYARDAQGVGVDPSDPAATCFCLIGALSKVGGISPDKVYQGEGLVVPLYVALENEGKPYSPHEYNDSAEDHLEVLELLDGAIQSMTSSSVVGGVGSNLTLYRTLTFHFANSAPPLTVKLYAASKGDVIVTFNDIPLRSVYDKATVRSDLDRIIGRRFGPPLSVTEKEEEIQG